MQTSRVVLRDRCDCSGALARRRRFLLRATATRELGIKRLAPVVRLAVLAGIVSLLSIGNTAHAQSFATIPGNPLRINVGSDLSFQVFNTDISLTVGQIFPGFCQNLADMGIFIDKGGTLYAPHFNPLGSNHCNTATSGIGARTPWTILTTSPVVTGTGTFGNPYTVVIQAANAAVNPDLQLTMTARYVNGDDFFLKTIAIDCFGNFNFDLFLGGDLYLATDDDGFPVRTGNAVGGIDCVSSTYQILYIPITPEDHYVAGNFATIWSQIGSGQLSDTVANSTVCDDNGAALQWGRTCTSGATVTVEARTSFGEIPSCIDPPSEMVGWWALDETGTTANDLAPFNNMGSHVGAPTPVAGQYVGNSLSFDGNDYVNVPDHPELDLGTGDFTIDAWVNCPTGTTNIRPIVDKRTENLDAIRGYTFFVVNGRLGVQMADGSFPSCGCSSDPAASACTNYIAPVGSPMVCDDHWNHVAVTVDRGSTTGGNLWLNGSSILNFNPTIRSLTLDNTSDLWIGRRHADPCAGTSHWVGGIDEVEIFYRELTQQEVQGLFDAGSAGKCKPPLAVGEYVLKCPCPGTTNRTWTFTVTNLANETIHALQITAPIFATIEPNPVPVNGPTGAGGLAAGESTTVTVSLCNGTGQSPSSVGLTLLRLDGSTIATQDVSGFNWGLGCPPCDDLQCDPNDDMENEACGMSVNGGCDVDPENYQDIFCETTRCGTLWAENGNQDTDWYNLVILPDFNDDGLSRVCITLDSEVPATVQLFELDPDCDSKTLLAQSSSSGCQVPPVLPARFCIVLPVPSPYLYKLRVFADCPPCGEILNGFPECTISPHNTYRLGVECFEHSLCASTGQFGTSFRAWWPLDETSGPIANELQHNADGSWVGGVSPTSGMVDGALHFDGNDGFVWVGPNSTVPSGISDLSVDAWVRWEPDATNYEKKPIVFGEGGGGGGGYAFYLQQTAPGKARLVLFLHGIQHNCVSPDIVLANQWYHVAATLQQATFNGCKLYINGQLVSESTPTSPAAIGVDGSLYIGSDYIGSPYFFKGKIDEVELFNRALGAAEINSIYLAGPAGKCKGGGGGCGSSDFIPLVNNCCIDHSAGLPPANLGCENLTCCQLVCSTPGEEGCCNDPLQGWDSECASVAEGSPVCHCPCAFTCPGGSTLEAEACGLDTNGGCDNLPGPETFEPLGTLVLGTPKKACGTLSASGGSRDTDWWFMHVPSTASGVATLQVVLNGSAPAEVLILGRESAADFGAGDTFCTDRHCSQAGACASLVTCTEDADCGVGQTCDVIGSTLLVFDSIATASCQPTDGVSGNCAPLITCVPANADYAIFVSTAQADSECNAGDGIFDGINCGGQDDYSFQVTATNDCMDGACCMFAGNCQDGSPGLARNEFECFLAGGSFQGEGSMCEDAGVIAECMDLAHGCLSAQTITCGSTTTVDLTTDDHLPEVAYACATEGADPNDRKWYKFTAPCVDDGPGPDCNDEAGVDTTSVRVDTCTSVVPGLDSLLNVLGSCCPPSGICPGTGAPCDADHWCGGACAPPPAAPFAPAGCGDDGCGFTDFLSDICAQDLIEGETYYIQVSNWAEPVNGVYQVRLACPCLGSCCDSATAVCMDGVAADSCADPLRFDTQNTCATLIPACGVGACCRPNGTCINATLAGCQGVDENHNLGAACSTIVCNVSNNCDYNTGDPTSDFDQAAFGFRSQYAEDIDLFVEIADQFEMKGDSDNGCLISSILHTTFHMSHDQANGCLPGGGGFGCADSPSEYDGIIVTISQDVAGDEKGPSCEPDCTTTECTPGPDGDYHDDENIVGCQSYTFGPALGKGDPPPPGNYWEFLTDCSARSSDEGTPDPGYCKFYITLHFQPPLAIEKHLKHWLAITHVLDEVSRYSVIWLASVNFNGNFSRIWDSEDTQDFEPLAAPNDQLFAINGNKVAPGCGVCDLFGDVAPLPSVKCLVDVDDLLCALDSFSVIGACGAGNLGDITQPGGICGPSGDTDVDDILAVLASFSGNFSCPSPCPPGACVGDFTGPPAASECRDGDQAGSFFVGNGMSESDCFNLTGGSGTYCGDLTVCDPDSTCPGSP